MKREQGIFWAKVAAVGLLFGFLGLRATQEYQQYQLIKLQVPQIIQILNQRGLLAPPPQ